MTIEFGRKAVWPWAILFCLHGPVLGTVTTFTAHEIPLLPETTELIPADVSNNGQVVGTAITSSGTQGFSYVSGTVTLLATPAGHSYCSGSSVNDLGQIVGGATEQFIPKAVYWASANDSAPVVLESSGGSDANVYTTGINNATIVSGYFTGSGSGNVSSWRAVKWVPDSQGRLRQRVLTTGVTPLPLGVFHAAYGVNNTGQVCGTGAWIDPNLLSSQAAIRWEPNDQPIELESPKGSDVYPRFEAHAINDAGVSVGWLTRNNGMLQAMLWGPDAAAADLGILTGYSESAATAINNNGVIIGQHRNRSGTVGAIFEGGLWANLNSRVSNSSDWSFQTAVAINDAGWIVGSGTHNGSKRGFVLIPQLPGDLDGNGQIDTADQTIFVSVLLEIDTEPLHVAGSDLNGDGAADGADIQSFIGALMQ